MTNTIKLRLTISFNFKFNFNRSLTLGHHWWAGTFKTLFLKKPNSVSLTCLTKLKLEQKSDILWSLTHKIKDFRSMTELSLGLIYHCSFKTFEVWFRKGFLHFRKCNYLKTAVWCVEELLHICVLATQTLVFQTGGICVGCWGATLHDGAALFPRQEHLLRVHSAPSKQWCKERSVI